MILLALCQSLILFSGCWGSPLIDIVIENQADQVLVVSAGGSRDQKVAPGQQLVTGSFSMDTGKYKIVAKNPEGRVVFSETYTFLPADKYHLEETNLKRAGVVKTYRAIIPPMATSADNLTGRTAPSTALVLSSMRADY
jgi:hypothetical protein